MSQDPIYFAPQRKLGGGWICWKDSPSPPPAPDTPTFDPDPLCEHPPLAYHNTSPADATKATAASARSMARAADEMAAAPPLPPPLLPAPTPGQLPAHGTHDLSVSLRCERPGE